LNSVIIGSSSQGNSVLYNNVLVDCGVPFAKLKPYLNVIDFVLLTHIHKDHFNKKSLVSLAVAKPNIQFVCCDWLEKDLMNLGILNIRVIKTEQIGLEAFQLQFKPHILISPFLLYHDVENCGWRISFDKFKIFHATDTVTLDGIEARGYDCYAIEFNYDEETIHDLIELKKEQGLYSYEEGAINSHLSFQQATRFIKENATKEYILLKLHISSRYKGEI
jgi:L-ascorbate metabolism protein UlaG (beta-lactamase superfamily)